MKHNQQITAQIQASFKQMKSDSDFLDLMNEAKKHVYGDKAVPFSMQQLKYHAFKTVTVKRSYVDIHELCKRLGITIDDTSSDSKRTTPLKAPKGGFNPIYHTFKVPKKGGGYRTICSPTAGLKAIQRTLAFILQCVFEPHKAATGFVRGKSVVDNAKMHEGNRYVYNIDLKDFFSSIDQARVWKCVQLKPFFLTGSTETVKVMNFDDFKQETNFKAVRLLDSFTYGRYLHFFSDDTEENYYTVRVGKNLNLPEGDLLDQIKPLVNDFSIYQGETANGPWISFGAKRPKGEFVSRGRLQIANIIASLCCTELEVERKNGKGEWEKVTRSVLPQGAPTSPVITNIVCQRLDHLLSGVARRFGLKYSRYADDITFSSMHNVYQPESDFLKELHRIIAEQNFHIKESKTRLQKDGYRKEVTGLLVNDKVNVQQRYIKQLRMWLYYWERYGYERASGFFLQQYIADKGHVKNGKPDMANVISGKLDYLKMVKGGDNELYQKLKVRFEKITGKDESVSKNLIEIEESEISNTPFIKLLSGLTEQPMVLSEEKIMDVLNEAKTDENTISVFHKPKELERLLCKFSENNHPLKYASHSWGDGKIDEHFDSYGDFIKKFDERGRSVCFEIQKIKKSLGTKILHFLNTPNENGNYIKKGELVDYYWGEHRMKYGWKSKELSIWANENPLIDPFEFPLPNKTIITRWNQDLEISKFGDVVGLFKSEIEIRPEKLDLYNLFLELRRKHLGRDFRVDVGDSLKGKQFYTDVHDFKRALNKIFHEISVRTIHPVVSISAKNYTEYGYTIIEVLHAESYCTEKTSNEMFKEINNGDFADILSYLENLCDWSVESEFSDGAYRINYLSSSETEEAVLPIEKAEGFKHVFKFYKS